MTIYVTLHYEDDWQTFNFKDEYSAGQFARMYESKGYDVDIDVR